MVNILLNRDVYPEFLGGDATAENVLNAVQQLTIPSKREKMVLDLKSADSVWQPDTGGAARLIANGIAGK